MVRRSALTALLLGFLCAPGLAQAAAACLTDVEFEAEQAIRLHTELMVVGLTCQSSTPPGQPSLFARYREFTDRHQAVVRNWESALIGHYRRTAKGNPARKLDSFRTSLANETSRRAIALTNAVFCADHVPAAERVLSLSGQELSDLLRQAAAVRVAAMPRCGVPAPDLQIADRAGGGAGASAGDRERLIIPAR